MDCQARGIAF